MITLEFKGRSGRSTGGAVQEKNMETETRQYRERDVVQYIK